MFDRLRPLILRVLRVPPEPHAPLGAEGSLQVFRAARNFYWLRVGAWVVAQIATAIGLVFSVGFLHFAENQLNEARAARQARAALAAAPAAVVTPAAPAETVAPAGPAPEAPKANGNRRRNRGNASFDGLVTFVDRFPWSIAVVKFLEFGAIALFVVSIPVTFAAVRLDYDYRWYLVTDRSLRIREGIWRLHETTMSFANLQQVEVTQGPVQRLLGLADVRVRSAGGGGGGEERKGAEDSMHQAVFHGVANAAEIRDLVLDRLRRYREAGLGDPDDAATPAAAVTASTSADALSAAREVLAEAQALRAALRR